MVEAVIVATDDGQVGVISSSLTGELQHEPIISTVLLNSGKTIGEKDRAMAETESHKTVLPITCPR